jgi:hypothetical protein
MNHFNKTAKFEFLIHWHWKGWYEGKLPVSVSLILLVGLPFWTSFLLVSLQDKLMPRKRERVSHVGNAECLTQSPVLNSEAEKHQLVSSNWYYNYKRSTQNWGKTY